MASGDLKQIAYQTDLDTTNENLETVENTVGDSSTGLVKDVADLETTSDDLTDRVSTLEDTADDLDTRVTSLEDDDIPATRVILTGSVNSTKYYLEIDDTDSSSPILYMVEV